MNDDGVPEFVRGDGTVARVNEGAVGNCGVSVMWEGPLGKTYACDASLDELDDDGFP